MDGARFDSLTRSLASRRGLLGGLAGVLASALGQFGRRDSATAATCKALGKPCADLLDCCSRTCSRTRRPDGRLTRRLCLCRETLKLPCGGRCCTRQQTCKRGRCIHHCKDGRISGDESDRDCGGDDCKKCALFQLCDRPRDCQSGHCARYPGLGPEPRCAECTADRHCGNAVKPRCFTGGDEPGLGGVCTQCTTDDHCLDAARPFCRLGDCVQCRDELDCPPGQLCEGGRCVSEPSCSNSIRDGDETDIDCGGPTCSQRCRERSACTVDGDCASNRCIASNQCFNQSAPCCQPCFNGNDCASGSCLLGGICAA